MACGLPSNVSLHCARFDIGLNTVEPFSTQEQCVRGFESEAVIKPPKPEMRTGVGGGGGRGVGALDSAKHLTKRSKHLPSMNTTRLGIKR